MISHEGQHLLPQAEKVLHVSLAPQGQTLQDLLPNGQSNPHPEIAEKLISCMQADVEHGFFRIEKYTKETPTDVTPYLKKWLAAEKRIFRATYKDYLNPSPIT